MDTIEIAVLIFIVLFSIVYSFFIMNVSKNKKEEISLEEEKKIREDLETEFGKVWNDKELTNDFEVINFLAPYVIVKRRSDNVVGSLTFTHRPRFYFRFIEEEEK